jgi:hypothetical protein
MESKGTAFWAVRIVEHDGEGHLLCEAGRGGAAVYHSKKRAEEVAEFMRDGLGDEVQHVSIARIAGRRARSLDSVELWRERDIVPTRGAREPMIAPVV